jgi:hypothetical protein
MRNPLQTAGFGPRNSPRKASYILISLRAISASIYSSVAHIFLSYFQCVAVRAKLSTHCDYQKQSAAFLEFPHCLPKSLVQMKTKLIPDLLAENRPAHVW